MSTVFLYMRSLLKLHSLRVGRPTPNKLRTVIGLLFAFVFFCCRILFLPLGTWRCLVGGGYISTSEGTILGRLAEVAGPSPALPWFICLPWFGFILLNLYWFYFILDGVAKAIGLTKKTTLKKNQ